MLPNLTKAKFFPVLSFPVFHVLALLIFPLLVVRAASEPSAGTDWHERDWWYTTPSSDISALEIFTGREGALGSRRAGGKQGEGQNLKPESQVPKTKL